jgi:hypothetical protein
MSKKHRDADLILKLYDMRRERTMREARDWFFRFNPQSPQDFIDVLLSDKSGYYRMVISYWDMACSFVNHGADRCGHVRKTRMENISSFTPNWNRSSGVERSGWATPTCSRTSRKSSKTRQTTSNDSH